MGNSMTIGRHSINFEDMQYAINSEKTIYGKEKPLIINTLAAHQQNCLIAGTLTIEREIEVLNTYLKKNKDVQLIIYGMNSSDETCAKKCEQLLKLGFYHIYIYSGGLFEWLLLQDIYGAELFPTTALNVDFLKYKGRQKFNVKMLGH